MISINVPRVRGKMAEHGYNVTSMATKLNISRMTLAKYLEQPQIMPYHIMTAMATLLCDSNEEATSIFFDGSLRKTQEQEVI